MALRRPTLLVCVLTIVLGINFEIGRPPFSEKVDGIYIAPSRAPKAKVTKGRARSHWRDLKTEAVDRGPLEPGHVVQVHREQCPASTTHIAHGFHTNASSSTEDGVKYRMSDFHTVQPSYERGRGGKTEVCDLFRFKPTSLSGGRPIWPYNVRGRKTGVADALSLKKTQNPMVLDENTASIKTETRENKSNEYVISTPSSVSAKTTSLRSSADSSKCCAGLRLPGPHIELEQLPHLSGWSTTVSNLEPARSNSTFSAAKEDGTFVSTNVTQRLLYPRVQLTDFRHERLMFTRLAYSLKLSSPSIKARDLGLYGNDHENCIKVTDGDEILVHLNAIEGNLLKVILRFHRSKGTEINASEPTLAWRFFEPLLRQKEFQPNGTDFTCRWKQNDGYLYNILLNISLYSSFHEKISRGKERINSDTHQNLKLVSLCFMLASTLLRNEELRRRLLQPLLMAMVESNSTHGAIKAAVRNILTREGLPSLLLNRKANSKPSEDIRQKTSDNETPSLAIKDRCIDFLHRWLDIPEEPNVSKIKPGIYGRDKSNTKAGFDLEKDTHRHPQWNRLSQFYTSFIPRRSLEYTVFPASILYAVGGSVKVTMSNVLNRLASLNSLPASCDISRVRLAEAGFYYDNSKTDRDASNVHEVVCYSCGFAYGHWNKGDNPTTVHFNLKPKCEHLKGKTGSNTTSNAAFGQTATASAPSQTSDRSMLSSASSGAYMSSESAPLSRSTSLSTFSSGNGSIATESLQQTSVPQSSLSSADSGIGTGSFSSSESPCDSSQQQSPSVNPSAASRIGGGDLATDCAAVIPQPIQRPSIQSGLSELAHDNATSFQSGHLGSSFDMSRARAQDLNDRPPLDMGCAVYPQFCRHQERRATFSTWPLANLFHPDDLVMQGFYYAGYADCLRCFYCGVGLKSWAEDDDVMLEHIRWRPSCGYVLNTKGKQFVDRVLQSIGQTNSSREQDNRESNNRAPQQNSTPTRTSADPAAASVAQSTTTRNATDAAPATTEATGTGAQSTDVTPSTSATASQTAAASANSSSTAGGNASKEVLRKVEDMGFSKDAIARAIRHFQQAGKTKISADALVEKILELDLDDSSNIAPGGNPTRSRDELQTDGPEGASNYALEADRQRAQRILSENERLRSRQTCKVCKEAKVGMIFLPCGHILACPPCGSKTKNCNHCGEFIRATANVYLS